jgi:flagellar biosynthesis chaperone FliJ
MGQFSKSILISIQKSLASKSAINEWYNLVNTYYPTINEYKNTLEQVEASLNDSVKIWETTQQEVLE